MENFNNIFPYLSIVKSIESFNDTYNVGFLNNEEKILLHKDYKIGDKIFVFPLNTILSEEFLNLFPYLDGSVDDDYKIKAFSYEGELFTNVSIPINLLNQDIVNSLESFKYDKPIKSFNIDNDKVIIVPDYSKDSINYKFTPYSREELDVSIQSIPTGEWKNPLNHDYIDKTQSYDVKDSWYNVLISLNEKELAEKIQKTPKKDRYSTILKENSKLYPEIEKKWREYILNFISANKISINDIISTSYDCIVLKDSVKIDTTKINNIIYTKENFIDNSFSLEAVQNGEKILFNPNEQYFLKPEQIEKLLEIRSMEDFDTLKVGQRDWLISIFSNKVIEAPIENDKDKKSYKKQTKTEVIAPLIPIEGYFTLPANTLPNQTEDIITTAGIYVFNMFVICAAFKHKIPYINYQMTSGNINKLNNDLSDLLLQNKIQVKDELEVYWNNITFLSYLTEMFMPGCPIDFIEELPEVQKLKKELCEKYKTEIAKGDAAFYADNIEKPLLALAKSKLKDNPSWDIYELGKKPSFDNNYKNCFVSVGPIYNFINESYDIVTNSFDDGVDRENYAAYCNQLLYGTYNRAVKTAYGGAQSKTLFSALSNIVLDEPGSDCKTKRTLKMMLEKGTANDYLYTYVKNPFYKKSGGPFNNNEEWIELLPDVLEYFIGKEVEMRSPLYCESPNYCNKCFGNLYYRMGINKAGLTTPVGSRNIMAKSMKAFHDSTIKTIKINLSNFLTEIN